ncbi:hypothetical protein SEA_VINCENZO_18 [Mycobacterium phage Vincenzo]|uniref:Uncharacterized protein n=2 Tax=Coopervirus vincenzo TaxID=1983110 RepID=A0A0F6YQ50_9CAUD|nr:hypothetical protein SEA_VINCENZO_18 [Mycobacterium phage Vincenzo]AKF14280.1 hypothetical protein SEA_VINCENZO_18 [Mycobacterium phage Vincenzo]AKF14683.1 hypothetical protein SEA_ALANGRANT_18 [Mycobacterium phage AlanGrant]
MTAVLELVYSFPFATGLVVGVVGQRAYAHGVAKYQDVHHPLPSGRHRKVPGISRVWVAGLVLLATLGYVLLQTGQTEAKYRGLARSMYDCQREFNQALKARSQITTENDRISTQQRDLFTALDEAAGTLVDRQLNPPADIAALPMDSPRRLAWNEDVARVYYQRTSKLRGQIADLRAEQTRLQHERAAHPLPEPTCGSTPPGA